VVEKTEWVGDWEADTIAGKGHRGAIMSLVDCVSKYTLLAGVDRMTAEAIDLVMIELSRLISALIRTTASDKRQGIGSHALVSEKTGADFSSPRPAIPANAA